MLEKNEKIFCAIAVEFRNTVRYWGQKKLLEPVVCYRSAGFNMWVKAVEKMVLVSDERSLCL